MMIRPILFSGPMVRAILDGRKTQTRRTVKLEIDFLGAGGRSGDEWDNPRYWGWENQDRPGSFVVLKKENSYDIQIQCPYGNVGDRLWVRETWQSLAAMNQCHKLDDSYVYRATDPDWETMDGWKWRPSIFMPRDASRLELEIIGVRVERLSHISNADCVAEGIDPIGDEKNIGRCLGREVYTQAGRIEGKCSTVRQLFSELWTNVNGPGSWASNPWVWVVEFKRL